MELKTVREEQRGLFTVRLCVWKDFRIEMLRHVDSAESPFRPSQVTFERRVLWEFRRNHPGFKGKARLEEFENEPVIVLATTTTLHHAYRIRSLPHMVFTTEGLVSEGGLKCGVLLKEALSERLGLTPLWSAAERGMREALEQERQSSAIKKEIMERQNRLAELRLQSKRDRELYRKKLREGPPLANLEYRAVIFRGEVRQMIYAPDKRYVRALRANNLAPEDLVVCPQKNSVVKLSIYRFEGDKIQTVGEVERKHVSP